VARAIPIKDLDGGAAEQKVVRDNDSGSDKLIKGIDGEVDGGKGILMGRMSPLEEVISS